MTSVLLVGGYGIVGAQVADLLARRNPSLELVLAGRSLEKARAAAQSLPNARAAVVDVAGATPLARLDSPPNLVVSLVNDPNDNLLRAAIESGAGYLDITRWTQRLIPALIQAAALSARAPVIFASSWMAGAPGLCAAHIARSFAVVDRIELNILYSINDKAGPNSIEYADQLAAPFQVLESGVWKTVAPLTSPRRVRFPGGLARKVRRFCTPDLEILPRVAQAGSVDVRIGYDSSYVAALMVFLVRSGVWRAISGERFESLRRLLLYHPGAGAAHEVQIGVAGRLPDNRSAFSQCSIVDPLGQTHLTAAATVVQIERALGLHGIEAPSAGIHFAESHSAPHRAMSALESMGVKIAISQQW